MKRAALVSLVGALLLSGAALAAFSGVQSHKGPQCFNIVGVGDSITLGSGVATPWPAAIGTALSSTASNQGVSSIGWNYNPGGTTGGSSLIGIAAANVDPLLSSLTCNGAQPYLVLFAGTNDIFYGATGLQAYGSFQTYLANRISAGWKMQNIIAATILQRAGDSTADRAAYNDAVVADQSHFALARLDLDPNIGCNTCNTNTTYFMMDQVHPNQTGTSIIANIICNQIVPKPGASCPAY